MSWYNQGGASMNVPLIANAITIRNKEKINLWYNGTNKIVDTGVKPYFYSYTDLGFPAEKETVDGIALSNYQKRKFVKYQFDTRKQMIDYIRHGETFEDEISKSSDMFVLRNRLDIPDLFTKFPHTNELKFLFFDIEQFTKPGIKFPTYDDRIVSVSWCTNNRDIKTICLKKETPTDKELLEKFIEAYEKIDPDVLVVYNKKYDIPTILQRCMINRLNTAKFSKNDRKPVIGKNNIPYINGIVVYDVYDSAREDQSLSGNVEDRGLKEVSNYFGFKEERKPLDVKKISEYLGSSELVEYNRDDVKRLLLLFDIYWPGIEFNANDLKIPLNLAVGMNITKLGIICMGDEYKKRNIIADGSNYDRYPEIFQRKKKQTDPNYQGALVGISKIGYFEPAYKADFSSMYPKIMSEFNLSPDTTTLLMFAPYDKFKIEEEENAFIYYIPDDVLKKTMVIQVSKSSGFLALLVKKFLDERAEYKKLYKATRDRKHESASNNRKVKANGGVYGNQGAANHPFGFAPIAIATCGFGREAGQMLIDILNELYDNCVVEFDSVTGDTPIFIRDKQTKLLDIVAIQDMSDGSIRNVVNNIEVLTRSGWKDLNYVYCHEVDKEIYIVDARGARIDVTEDHSLYSNGKVIQPKELKKGSIIDIYPAHDYGGNDNNINAKQAWFYGFFVSDGSITIRNRSVETIKRMGVDFGTSYELKIGQKNKLPLEKTQEILKNDFGLDSKIYQIGNVPSYKDRYYKIEVITKNKDVTTCKKVEYAKHREDTIKHIHDICYCKDGKTKKVPKEILNAPLNVVNAFFDGLTTGDGSVGTSLETFGIWSIGGKFKPLMAGIAYLLDRRGITYMTACRKDKLNITNIATHKPQEFCVHKNVKKGNPGIVTKLLIEKRKQKVYDLSTDDGTFVAGIGRVVCHNTDGVYFSANNIDENKIMEIFNKRLEEKFKKKLDLTIDIDKYDSGYFYKSKNYVLKRGDKIIKHGVAMKAQNKNLLSKSLIDELAYARVNNKSINDIQEKYLKLDLPLEHFAMNVTMGMELHEYKNKNDLVSRLARMAEKELGIKPQIENKYYYVKEKNDYTLLELASRDRLDIDYYRSQVKRILEMFDASIVIDSIDNWI
jgi:DNA polymerase elongation subunit (family B)